MWFLLNSNECGVMGERKLTETSPLKYEEHLNKNPKMILITTAILKLPFSTRRMTTFEYIVITHIRVCDFTVLL